jgi:hypothetical protein
MKFNVAAKLGQMKAGASNPKFSLQNLIREKSKKVLPKKNQSKNHDAALPTIKEMDEDIDLDARSSPDVERLAGAPLEFRPDPPLERVVPEIQPAEPPKGGLDAMVDKDLLDCLK